MSDHNSDYPLWARAGFAVAAALDRVGLHRASFWLACKVGWYSCRTVMERAYKRTQAAARSRR